MSQEHTGIARALFRVKTTGEVVNVHFNPVSLQYTVANQMQQQGGGTQQHVASSTGKLSVDLIFDTTHTGGDVRVETAKVAALMKPGDDHLVPTFTFEWGAYKFEGTMEGYRETLDFFSPDGVPLRASLSLSLAATDAQVFVGGDASKTWNVTGELAPMNTVEVPPTPLAARGGLSMSPAGLAAMAGNPRAARALAAANGVENLRFGAPTPMAVSSGIKLSPPVAFAPAAALGVPSGGAPASAGLQLPFGIAAKAGAPASAGVPASQGAFAGLATSAKKPGGAPLDIRKLVAVPGSTTVTTEGAARFAVGGRALVESGGSLRADVGGTRSVRFDQD
jgi:hypothetical protein